MWILILVIFSLPVSGALQAEMKLTGIVGRSITINCKYNGKYRQYVKYWCQGWTERCSYSVRTDYPDGRRGRMSITDNKTQAIFAVTMEDLRLGDAGGYSCGIDKPGKDPKIAAELQISEEPVSVPELRFLSPPNATCSGGSVSVSCESVQGSLPIQYTWYENTTSEDSKTSDTNKLDLHCQSFTQQHHQYYCTASNNQGEKSSEMVTVSVIHISENDCSYLTQISNIAASASWAKNNVTGVLGRSITIDCHYDKLSQSHVKYWSRQCSVLVKSDDPDGRRGRMSITDNKTQGFFVVTMEDLHSEDAGWYSCGIDKPGLLSIFPVKLQISDEPLSVPELRFLSPPNATCFGGSVSVSCESVQGSLPIQYTWYENTTSEDSKTSDTNKLDLHCQSFKQQHHQYYCTASNNQGGKSSEMVTVSVIHISENDCSYLTQISNIAPSALWAKNNVTGVLGRSITIDCHYDNLSQSHVKSWSRQCSVLVKSDDPDGRRGRMSITDNKTQGFFVVTMEDLHSEDAGWYSCGIDKPGLLSIFPVKLQISDEPLSVPELRFLSPPNATCSGGSVSVSCESVQGSLPIQYTWYENTTSEDSKISDTNKLDLHCQSFTQQHHQYYCTASNNQGEKSSEMVTVSVIHISENDCSYVTQISNIAPSALWAKNNVTGVLGRSITIDCHYDKLSQSHVKYWSRQCSVLVKSDDPDGRRGRMSITDNKTQGFFVVTMEDLHSEDAGWYSCGIDKPGLLSIFPVKLQISDEPVSVPELKFLSPPNASCSGGSMSVSCESVQGSLPIQYTWYEKTPSEDSKISDTNKLDLHCQSFTQQHHQYYCTASNHQGEKSSEMVTVSVIHISENDCSYVTQISNIASSALWAKNNVTGVLGRSITIDCHYDKLSQSHVKSWSRQCSVLVKSDDPDGRRGRISITDHKTQGLFVVTMEDLHSGDAGWYSCGIDKPGLLSIFPVKLQISDEPVSAPELKFLSPPNASCSGGSVSVSCESVQGSFPIQYIWYEKTPSEDSKVSDTNKLDLHCQSFTQQHHQYYCTASNHQGEKSSEMVPVSVINRSENDCSYVTQISNIAPSALWAKNKITGILGRSITIDCHYDKLSQSHVKSWSRQCSVLVKSDDPDGRRGRMSITDNKTQGLFVVTMEDLRSGDAGWYSCGIDQPGLLSMFPVKLQISDEPVSVPELKFLSPPNASCSGGSVSLSCESVQGSLPIQYTWYEKTPSEDSKISDTNKLGLHCQSFKQQHHQYYCTASNNQGEKSSEMVTGSVIHISENDCSYLTQISNIGAGCERTVLLLYKMKVKNYHMPVVSTTGPNLD
ncbi:titin-like [Mustelus asterias]